MKPPTPSRTLALALFTLAACGGPIPAAEAPGASASPLLEPQPPPCFDAGVDTQDLRSYALEELVDTPPWASCNGPNVQVTDPGQQQYRGTTAGAAALQAAAQAALNAGQPVYVRVAVDGQATRLGDAQGCFRGQVTLREKAGVICARQFSGCTNPPGTSSGLAVSTLYRVPSGTDLASLEANLLGTATATCGANLSQAHGTIHIAAQPRVFF